LEVKCFSLDPNYKELLMEPTHYSSRQIFTDSNFYQKQNKILT